METFDNPKVVDFHVYCKICKHWKSEDVDRPCTVCLDEPVRDNTRKPIKYEEAE